MIHCPKAITERRGIFDGVWWAWKRGDILDGRTSKIQGTFRGHRKKVFNRDMVLLVLSYLSEELFKK
jgi:hypothetical protein